MTKPKARRRARGNGEGSIRQRPDGTWEARYTAGNREGKQVRKSIYGKTRTEVASKLKSALVTFAPLSADDDVTLVDYMRRIAQERVGHVSPRTSEIDLNWVTYTDAHPTGHLTLGQIKPSHLEKLYRDMAATYSRSVVMHTRTFINLALKQAVKGELIPSHPGLVADAPRMTTPKVAQAATPEQVQAILNTAQALPDQRWYCMIYTAVSLGLRHGELLGLQWGDINTHTAELRIARAVSSNTNGTPRITQPKTKGSARTLYLTPDHLHVFKIMRDYHAMNSIQSEWVFTNRTGGLLEQGNVRRKFQQILEQAGVPRLRMHDLRHTFATFLIAQGHDPKTVSDLMGHTDARLTLAIYTHTQEQAKKRAALTAVNITKSS